MASPARSHSVHINAITGTGPDFSKVLIRRVWLMNCGAEVCKSRLKFRCRLYTKVRSWKSEIEST